MRNPIVYLALFSLLFLQMACTTQSQNAVEIVPAHPERGDRVTITYHTDAPDAKIPPDAQQVQIVFTYSTLYQLPYTVNMKRKGDQWQFSFIVPRYFTYATFYFKSDSLIDQPAPDRHYALAAYSGNQRVKNGYLYEAYSLPAQMGNGDSLNARQEALYKKELNYYPNNYEAELRLIKSRISMASDTEKTALLAKANKLINQQFKKAPGKIDNINQVTMGYLIMGEKNRLDSIRKVVFEQYPHSGAAKQFTTVFAAREPDTTKRIAMLEEALKDESEHPEDAESYSGIHEMLFSYYAVHKEKAKALYHARKIAAIKNPYRPATLKEIAEKLTVNNLALDTALAYANGALKRSDSFPVGIIRYFPEFGYIPSYVNDSARQATLTAVKGNLLALKGLIYAKKGEKQKALSFAQRAEKTSDDSKTLQHLAQTFEQLQQPEGAMSIYKKMLVISPSDSEALQALKANYRQRHHTEAGFDTVLLAVKTAWRQKMVPQLREKMLNQPLPKIDSLRDMNGKLIDPEIWKNKVVIMDFWATWCVPCMHEMPYLQKVYDQYKNNPDVVFMVINSGSNNSLKDAQQWQKRMPYTFPIYYTNDPKIGSKLAFNVIPALFVIDRKGKIQFKTIGFEGPDVAPLLKLKINLLLE